MNEGDILKTIVSINSVNYGSTGNIMLNVANKARKEGNEYYSFCAFSRSTVNSNKKNCNYIGGVISRNLHLLFSEVTGIFGVGSIIATKRLLRRLDKINPDYLHLHNLHNGYINLPMLFGYIKRKNISVIWTLHDCWAFTGGCPHFTIAKCDKWKTGCFDCPNVREYPSSMFDNSKVMWNLKKKWFTRVNDLTIVTPSKWLAGLVKQSFLKDYPVEVINNGIDLTIFKPTESSFRDHYDLKNMKIVLGVAFGWGIRKGLDVFIELSKQLPDNYKIVLVGTTEEIDKQLPKDIISIHKTSNQKELAEIYTAADVFANPTREEVLGLVNLEANACGTPVITFKTGGSPECITRKSGIVVERDDINGMLNSIRSICEEKIFNPQDCIENALSFEVEKKYEEYIKLYK